MRALTPFTFLPRPQRDTAYAYQRVCSRSNLRYTRYFALLACIVFGFHLLHHLRLGAEVLNNSMLPFTVIYTFGVLYSAFIMLVLSHFTKGQALNLVTKVIEHSFPIFMAVVAIGLSIFSVEFRQGITPYPIILMMLSFLLQGQVRLLFTLIISSWLALSGLLVWQFPVALVSPAIAIGFTSAFACLVIAFLMEKLRIEQFEMLTALNNNNRQLRQLSNRDHLTGLLNRRAFDRLLEQEMARSERFGRKLSLLIVDVDNFKHVNDTYGHVQGDEIIRQVADAISKRVREVDSVGRLGGDEMVVLLVETDKQTAVHIADRMCKEVAALDGTELLKGLTISIGHAEYQGESMLAFLERADKALYQAKRSGKNRVRSAHMGIGE